MEVGIIGGGASGMFAAIQLAKAGISATILEKNDRPGKKILATGNGKCNLGNEDIIIDNFYTSEPKLLEKRLASFGGAETMAAFDEMGLIIKNKNGLFYPLGEQASIVLDVLRFTLKSKGVQIITEANVKSVNFDTRKHKYKIEIGDHIHYFDKLIVATGGNAAPKTGSDGWGLKFAKRLGHKLIPTVPALVQLKCKETYFKSISGVRAEASISVQAKDGCRTERGELQLTEYGISGIPVFQLSRSVNYMLLKQEEVPVTIDFFPGYTLEALERIFRRKLNTATNQTVEEFFTGFLNKKLMLHFIKLAGCKPTDKVTKDMEQALFRVLQLSKQWTVHVNAHNSYDNAQVTAGGVRLSELTEYLASTKDRNIYFIGEVVDVDGLCGGFNLHWAWCSGYLAAEGIRREQNA